MKQLDCCFSSAMAGHHRLAHPFCRRTELILDLIKFAVSTSLHDMYASQLRHVVALRQGFADQSFCRLMVCERLVTCDACQH